MLVSDLSAWTLSSVLPLESGLSSHRAESTSEHPCPSSAQYHYKREVNGIQGTARTEDSIPQVRRSCSVPDSMLMERGKFTVWSRGF